MEGKAKAKPKPTTGNTNMSHTNTNNKLELDSTYTLEHIAATSHWLSELPVESFKFCDSKILFAELGRLEVLIPNLNSLAASMSGANSVSQGLADMIKYNNHRYARLQLILIHRKRN